MHMKQQKFEKESGLKPKQKNCKYAICLQVKLVSKQVFVIGCYYLPTYSVSVPTKCCRTIQAKPTRYFYHLRKIIKSLKGLKICFVILKNSLRNFRANCCLIKNHTQAVIFRAVDLVEYLLPLRLLTWCLIHKNKDQRHQLGAFVSKYPSNFTTKQNYLHESMN